MNFKVMLIEAGKLMLSKGFTAETWGNISLRDPQTGLFYITPSGMSYDSLLESDIVIIDRDGARIEGSRKPSIEKSLHLRIYEMRPEINAIVHTHPIYSTVFGVLQKPIPPIIDEAAQTLGGTVEVAEYGLPGTDNLAENACCALGSKMACLLSHHGAICVGSNLEQALKVCNVLEITAQIYKMALSIGHPTAIDSNNIDKMNYFLKHNYGQ